VEKDEFDSRVARSTFVMEAIQTQRTTSLVLLFLNFVLTIYVILSLIRANWTFLPLLADFGTDLPLLTRVMLSPWAIGGLVFLLLASVAKELLLTNKRFALILNAVHLLFMLLVWQLHLEAIMLPLLRLIQTLS